MNRIFKLLIIIVLGSISALFSSCSTNKYLPNGNLNIIPTNHLIEAIDTNSFVFNEFQTKYSAKIVTADAKLSVKGQLRIKNDSIIWASVSLPVGMEVMRIMITKDSVFLINRTDKTFIEESIEHFKKIPKAIANISYLQSLLVGNDITLERGIVKIEDNKYNLLIYNALKMRISDKPFKEYIINKTLVVNPDNYRIEKCLLQTNNNKNFKADVFYDDFEEINGKVLPKDIEISMTDDPKLSISISYSNISINEEQEYKFSIPKKYKRQR